MRVARNQNLRVDNFFTPWHGGYRYFDTLPCPQDCVEFPAKRKRPERRYKTQRSAVSDPAGVKYVVFHRSRMLHLDVSLHKADLRYRTVVPNFLSRGQDHKNN